MGGSFRGGWLAVLLLSGVTIGESLAQTPQRVRPIAAGSVEISDLRPTSGVQTRRPAATSPRLLEVESGVELQPIDSSRSSSRTPANVAGRSKPKTRVIEIPEENTTPDQESEAGEANPGSASGDDAIELNRRVVMLRDRLRRTLDYYYHRKLNTRENTHWEVMHQIVAFGVKAEIRKNSARGEPVNAISWLCWNQPCAGEKMMYTLGNLPAARQGPRVQGHEGQFLKMLAMSGVSPDYPMLVDGKQYKISDLIEQEKLTCRTKMELTFKLISLAYYLEDLDESWRARDGQVWNIERLIREELSQPILRDAACGGTHRLMGFSMALRQRRRAGQPIDGEFERAEKYINDYVKYTLGLQNSDGSFSTEWFRRRAAEPSLDRRLQTSGHILEWLVFTVPDEVLVDPRIVRAVEYVARILDEGRARQWEIGPLGHALHAISIYERRVSYLEAHEEEEETPKTEPAPVKPAPKALEKKEPEVKTPEKKSTPEKAAPEKALPEKSAPVKTLPEAKKPARGPIQLPPDAERKDEVDVGASSRRKPGLVTEPLKPQVKPEVDAKDEPAEVEPKQPVEPKLTQPKAAPKKALAPKAKPEPKEPQKAEDSKAGEPKQTDEPKAEEPKAEEKKAEEKKADDDKAEEPKQGEEPKSEESKAEKKVDDEQAEKPLTEEAAPKEEAEAPKDADQKGAEPADSEPAKSEAKAAEDAAGEPQLPSKGGEPTPADPAESPAEEKSAENPEKTGAEPGKPQESDAASEAESKDKSSEPAVIKSAPAEETKDESQAPAQDQPGKDEEQSSDKAEEGAKPESTADAPEKSEGFHEPNFDLDPLADPTGDGAHRAPRSLQNLEELSRAGRLPPVEGAEDIRTAAPRRKTTVQDLWDSPVFDPHRALTEDEERAAGPLPAPPVEAVDSPSQPVARVGGRSLRPARTQPAEGESTFPKILKRRLGILFVPKSVVPAR